MDHKIQGNILVIKDMFYVSNVWRDIKILEYAHMVYLIMKHEMWEDTFDAKAQLGISYNLLS